MMCELSVSFNPFQPPEIREQLRPAGFAQASFSEFLMRGLLCAGLFALVTGIEQLLPELPFKNAAAFTGLVWTVLCTAILLLACGWLVQSELPGTWFLALGVALGFVAVTARFFLVLLVARTLPVSSFAPLLFVINLVLNVVETVGLTVAFGWLTGRQLRFRVFVVTIVLCFLSTGLSFLVFSIPRFAVGTISANILLWTAISISGSFGLLGTASALWYVNLQAAKVS
jgi:hypothetical protein